MGRKPEPETLKVAKNLVKEYIKLNDNRKSNRIFEKDIKKIAKSLNQISREIAKKDKRKKVIDVQNEIIEYINKIT